MQHRSIAMSMRQPRGMGDERHTMDFRETFLLRTKLRQVNMEYSALVRDRTSERRFVRMDELRIERRALMNLLFGGASSKRRPLVSRSDVALQQLADLHREGSEHLASPIHLNLERVLLRPTSSETFRRVSS